MKAILEFDLTEPDDSAHLERCMRANEMASVLWEINANLKKKLEWTIDEARQDDKNFTAYDAIDLFYDKFRQLMEEHSINIDKIYA